MEARGLRETLLGTARLPMGATLTGEGVRFAVWAPSAGRVDVELHRGAELSFHPMPPIGDGVFAATIREARPGDRYLFRLDGKGSYPDPCSCSQPEGVHGPSEVVDHSFSWHDDGWAGLRMRGLVIYECHVGTYTPEGTFDALAGQLPELRRLGVTAIELMPVAEFPGTRNWGYDGVDLYAPSRNYGGVLGLKRLVDRAHTLGLGVILDVVYNHLGPDGNYLRAFSPYYFTDRYVTPWGEALSYDGPHSDQVREFVIQNAIYWLTRYHVDGLRLDATHAIFDRSETNILEELAARCRAAVGDSRGIVLMAENETNDVRLIRPRERGGYGFDAVWADDFHHSVRVFLTGRREGYFADFEGTVSEIARGIDEGFIFQGQASPRLGRARGTRVTDEPLSSFVFCIQNHDQVGNRPFGDRINELVDIATYGVASTLLLMVPETPMLFMGQEFAASTPFLYFTDHEEELGRLVTSGRRQEFSYMEGFADPVQREQVPDPQAEDTFVRSRLRLQERWEHRGIYRLYRDLLKLRNTDPVLAGRDGGHVRAQPLGERALAVWRWSEAGRRLIVANFGPELRVDVNDLLRSEPAPRRWRVLLSTTAARYDGVGARCRVSRSGKARSLEIASSSAAVLALD